VLLELSIKLATFNLPPSQQGKDSYANYIHFKTDNPDVFAASESYIAVLAKHDAGIQLFHLDQYDFNQKKPDEIAFDKKMMVHSADTSRVRDVAFSPFKPNILVSSHSEKGLKLWDCDANEMIQWKQDLEAVSACWHNYVDSLLLVNQGTDASVSVYDIKGDTVLNTVQLFDDTTKEVSAVNWFNHQEFVFGGSNTIGVRDIRGGDDTTSLTVELKNNLRIDAVLPVRGADQSVPNHVLFIGSSHGAQQFGIIDIRKQELLSTTEVNRGSSKQYFHFDQQNHILYVGAKGYAQLKYYDVLPTITKGEAPIFLNTFTSDNSFSAITALPERVVDVSKTEVARFVKLLQNKTVELMTFHFPKKMHQFEGNDIFHEDMYAPVPTTEPSSVTAEAFYEGQTGEPNTKSLQPENTVSVYDVPVKEGGKLRPGQEMSENDHAPVSKSKYTIQQEKEAAEKARKVDPFAKYRHESATSSLSEGIAKAVSMAIDSDDEDLHQEESDISDGEMDW